MNNKETSIKIKQDLAPEDQNNIEEEARNSALNTDAEYDLLVEEELAKDKKYQDVIDYIKDSELMDIKKANGEELTSEQIRTWDESYGKVYISKITDDPIVYIWKPLFRLEYIKLISSSDTDAECNWGNDISRQTAVLKKCLLFPESSSEFIARSRAGIVATLESQIMYQSGFISEQQAIDSINVIG